MAGKFELPIGYSQDLECRVLELPFSKKRISMFLLLPDDAINGLTRLEANISTENIQHLLGTLKVRMIDSYFFLHRNCNFEKLICIVFLQS